MSAYRVVGDWGTSRLRLFRIEGGTVADRRDGPGIGALSTPPEDVLRAALLPWRADGAPDAVRLCGMVGSRNGWRDVAYVECPADRDGWRRAAATLRLDDVPVTIMAGLATTDAAGVPDVMRGEETQIFGALALDPRLGQGRHTIALPGTHGKWASVVDGRIVAFRTYPTGELFALLRDHSTLARAGAAPEGGAPEEADGFADGLARIYGCGHLLGALFAARSMQVRGGRSRAWALGYLSGLVIGSEIAEAASSLRAEEEPTLVGDPGLAALYVRALGARGITARLLDGDACAIAGLTPEPAS